MKCPICKHIMEKYVSQSNITFAGKVVPVELYGWRCNHCENQLGDDISNDKALAKAKKIALQKRYDEILNKLKSSPVTFSEIERIFSLPKRSLSKWLHHKIKPSASSIALLRIIDSYPWIIESAGKGIETKDAQFVPQAYYAHLQLFDTNVSYASKTRYNIIRTTLTNGVLTPNENSGEISNIVAIQEEIYEG